MLFVPLLFFVLTFLFSIPILHSISSRHPMRDLLLTATALLLSFVVWLPLLRFVEAPPGDAATALAAGQLRQWSEPALRAREVERMRAGNAEWDFMGRTFLGMALCEVALREPARQAECLAVVDAILDETLRLEAAHGQVHFQLSYARSGPYRDPGGRSLFVDGELLLLAAARRLVAEREDLRAVTAERAAFCRASLERGPILCGESYPDECWTFCNAAALAGLRLSDAVDGTDHAPLARRWVESARAHLIDPTSGLLVSSFRWDGAVRDGPEGSSIWFAIHALWFVDEPFAREQWERARAALGRDLLGFGWAREWPPGVPAQEDVDSGPVVPLVEASASSSGLALLAAATAGDEAWLTALRRSLELGAFPIREDGALRYAASNQVGDAVLLYALTEGALRARAQERLR